MYTETHPPPLLRTETRRRPFYSNISRNSHTLVCLNQTPRSESNIWIWVLIVQEQIPSVRFLNDHLLYIPVEKVYGRRKMEKDPHTVYAQRSLSRSRPSPPTYSVGATISNPRTLKSRKKCVVDCHFITHENGILVLVPFLRRKLGKTYCNITFEIDPNRTFFLYAPFLFINFHFSFWQVQLSIHT